MIDNVKRRIDELKNFYSMLPHIEGGYFSEVYTSTFLHDGRSSAGSIYFMLTGKEISCLHKIDCDEIWYYHEGCGLKITMLNAGEVKEFFLGKNLSDNQKMMIVIPAGAIFAAENIDANSYTFVSCVTTPAFNYDGFQLINKQQLSEFYPQASEKILRLAYSEDFL